MKSILLFTCFAAANVLAVQAHAKPANRTTECAKLPHGMMAEKILARGEPIAEVTTLLPDSLAGGKLYCTAESENIGSMFAPKLTHFWRQHQRGVIDGVPYRIDYFYKWAAIYTGKAAEADTPDIRSKFLPDAACDYVAPQLGASDVSCVSTADEKGHILFYYSTFTNAIRIFRPFFYDLADSTDIWTQKPIRITTTGGETYLEVPYGGYPPNEAPYSVADSGKTNYKWLFAGATGLGSNKPASSKEIFIDPKVAKFIGEMAKKEHFEVGFSHRTKGTYEYTKVPTARTINALKIMPTVAQAMEQAAK